MYPLLRKLLSFNWVIVVLMTALTVFGIVVIYSCTYKNPNPVYAEMWNRQAMWAIVGGLGFLAASLIDYRWIKLGALPMYLVSLVFLILTLAIGVKLEGARSWLRLGGIQFQPAQLAVLSGILVLALFLSHFRKLPPLHKIIGCGITAGAPALLILKQPDFGETMIWGPVVFSMLFAARIPYRYLIALVLLLAAAAPPVYYMGLKPYQQARITSFLDPEIDPQGASWAVNQVMIAIGSGGWAGKGFLAENTQVDLGYVPSTTVPNDYIYAAIGEQWGFRGGVLVIGTFAALILTCLYVAYRSADDLGMLTAVGITALIFTHTFQNIGMNVSILPVTGVPLPLISYSGTFLAVIMFGLGIVNSIWIHRKALPGNQQSSWPV